jgi:ABC-type transporter Mla MlaB component
MSDTNENKTEETEGKSSLIGVNPLAWLSDEEKKSVLDENKETVTKAEEKTAEVQSGSTSYQVDLESAVTIRDVAELLDELNNIDAGIIEIVFECAQIEKTDAAALQLLTGYYLFAIEEGKQVVWNNPSEAFCYSVNLLGLSDIINVSLAA